MWLTPPIDNVNFMDQNYNFNSQDKCKPTSNSKYCISWCLLYSKYKRQNEENKEEFLLYVFAVRFNVYDKHSVNKNVHFTALLLLLKVVETYWKYTISGETNSWSFLEKSLLFSVTKKAYRICWRKSVQSTSIRDADPDLHTHKGSGSWPAIFRILFIFFILCISSTPSQLIDFRLLLGKIRISQ